METCTRLLRNACEKFVRADNGTDRDAIEFMCENWPNNFMLQNREDTTSLELSLQATARRIDDKIYTAAARSKVPVRRGSIMSSADIQGMSSVG